MMALPSIQDLMRPVLEAHPEGAQMRLGDLIPSLLPVFSITEEEQSQRQPSGEVTLVQRVNWARDNLFRMGLLERPSRGVTAVTQEGLRVAASDEVIVGPSSEWAASPVSRASVLSAIAEFDREGRERSFAVTDSAARSTTWSFTRARFDAKALYGIASASSTPTRNRFEIEVCRGGGGQPKAESSASR